MFSTGTTYTQSFGCPRVNCITNDCSISSQETYDVAVCTTAYIVLSINFFPQISANDKLSSINSGVGIPLYSYLKNPSICAGHVLIVSTPCNVSTNRTMQK